MHHNAKHILLVEDNPADMYVIKRAIAAWSPQLWLWQVSKGSEALAFLRKEPPFPQAPVPALILLDLNIPGTDGYDLLPQLRRLPAYQTTPVIVTSAKERAREEPRCLQLGANAYIEKQIKDFPAYIASIRAMMKDLLGSDCPPP
jgi:CheY-like chemotaxis protein